MRALLSVFDKTGIVELAQNLIAQGYELVSSGGTYALLQSENIPALQVEDVTGFPECLDGRVKTLHPKIHAGILANRAIPAHMDTLATLDVTTVDVVVVNLYPFKAVTAKPDHTLADAIENIDIGGPSLIRAAAKNYQSVVVLTDPADYGRVAEQLATKTLDTDARLALATKAYTETAAYDTMISKYLTNVIATETAAEDTEQFPEKITLELTRKQAMRYGENPHQAAAYYVQEDTKNSGIEQAEILHGKELSFNNIGDAESALELAREFEEPVCVAIKHATPCGVAIADTIEAAYQKAYDCDPVSIFGGIVCFNREVTLAVAEKLHQIFLEVIIAPSFAPDALALLTQKKNIRILQLPVSTDEKNVVDIKGVGGGFLLQESNDIVFANEPELVTKANVTPEQYADLVFAMRVVKHVKSNAIVLAKDGQTVGIGGGEVSRIWATEAAINRAGAQSAGAVMASDAFFPFADVVELCAEHDVAAIIQPGGSIHDADSIAACDVAEIPMFLTGIRHFKH